MAVVAPAVAAMNGRFGWRIGLAAVAAALALAVVGWRVQVLTPELAGEVARLLVLGSKLALLSAAFVGWGDVVARRLGSGQGSWSTRWALGAVVTATVMGLLAPWWFPTALFVAPWALAGVALALAAARRQPPRLPQLSGPWWLWLVVAVFLQAALLVALSPPVALDSLVYHLAVPRQAAFAGQLVDTPWMQLGYLPLHAEMLYGAALALDGGMLAQLVAFSAAALALWVAARLAGRLHGAAAGPWAAALLASAPLLAVVAGYAGNDWFVMLYLALALEAHLATTEQGRKWGLEGLFVGAAIATKYTALPALLLLLPFRRRDWRGAGFALLLAGVVAVPWYGRNLLLRGNPFHPLLSGDPVGHELSYFRGDAPLPERLFGYLGHADLTDESFGLLLAPALTFGLLAFGLLAPARRRPPAVFLALAAVYALTVVFSHPTARAFAPLLLLLAVLAAGGLAGLAATRRRSAVAAAIVLPLVLLNLLLVLVFNGPTVAWRLAVGAESEEAMLRHTEPYVLAYRWIAERSPTDAGVLVVGESRVFHLQRRAFWASHVDPHPLEHFVTGERSASALARNLLSSNVQLIYFYPPNYHVGQRPPGVANSFDLYVTPESDQLFQALLRDHAVPVFRDHQALVFAVAPGAGVAPRVEAPAAGAPG